MSTKFGSPYRCRCPSIANLLHQSNLISITNRIKQINANIVVKTRLGYPTYLSDQLALELNNHLGLKTYLTHPIATIKSANIQLENIEPDLQHFILPPWEPIPFSTKVTLPPSGKKQSDPIDLLRLYTKEITELNLNKGLIVYTDGSVKHDLSSRAGSATIFVNNNDEVVLEEQIRITNGSSSMQAELTAIATTLALTSQHECNNLNLVIHTDSLSSIQAISNRTPPECKDMLSMIQKLGLSLKSSNCHTTLHYIPSHIGIPGNELADQSADQATAKNDIHILKVNPSKSALKARITATLYNSQYDLPQNSRSMIWYHSITKNIKNIPSSNRKTEVGILRILLGYRSYNQLVTKLHQCDHCDQNFKEPLLHFTLECPFTAPHIPKDTFMEIQDEDMLAAYALNNLIKTNPKVFVNLLSNFPVPR